MLGFMWCKKEMSNSVWFSLNKESITESTPFLGYSETNLRVGTWKLFILKQILKMPRQGEDICVMNPDTLRSKLIINA